MPGLVGWPEVVAGGTADLLRFGDGIGEITYGDGDWLDITIAGLQDTARACGIATLAHGSVCECRAVKSPAKVESISKSPAKTTAPKPAAKTGVPQKATDVLSHVKSKNSAPPGYKGGRTFENDGRGGGQVFPKADAQGNPVTYREFDVNPHTPGVNRGAEGIVVGSDGKAYYTSDLYGTFTPFP